MNSNTIKILTIATVCILIVGAVAGYFIWETNELNKALDIVRNNLDNTLIELNTTKDKLDATQENLRTETEKSNRYSEELNAINKELEVANTTIADLKDEEYRLVYIGNFKLTHYCTEKREHICGTGAGLTATGTKVTAGRSVAVDPSVIPYGTRMYIEGYGWRTAEDCGGGVDGSHIDIAVETHSQALAMGTGKGGVWILVKAGS